MTDSIDPAPEAPAVPEAPDDTCSVCHKTYEWKTPPTKKRLPMAWHRRAGLVYCNDCWGSRFILRAITIPVLSPVDGEWGDLSKRLHAMWGVSTSASNWMMTQFYVRDAHRQAGMTKMPLMPKIYLYPEAKDLFSELPTPSIANLENTLKKKYKAKRREIIWKYSSSLPTYRYPAPFAVPNQAWSVSIVEGHPVVSAPIGSERLKMRLRAGPEYRRQLAAVREIVSGEAKQGEMAIFRKGHGKTSNIMCKMVAWFPRREGVLPEGTLIVRSGPDALLQAFNLKDEVVWSYHGDHLRGLIAQHKKRIQHFADDSKAELRPKPPFMKRRRFTAERFRAAMDTNTHTIAAMLVQYAIRRKFKAILYNDGDTSFGEGLPWAELRLKVDQKCHAAGIEFLLDKGAAAAPEEEGVPEPEKLKASPKTPKV